MKKKKPRTFTIINTNSVPPYPKHILQLLWTNYPNSAVLQGQRKKREKERKPSPISRNACTFKEDKHDFVFSKMQAYQVLLLQETVICTVSTSPLLHFLNEVLYIIANKKKKSPFPNTTILIFISICIKFYVHNTEVTCTLQYGLKIYRSIILYYRSLEKSIIKRHTRYNYNKKKKGHIYLLRK